MASVAKGWACHSGAMPPKSGIVVLLESPGPDEPVYLTKELPDGLAEIQRRHARYPDLEPLWINKGVPVVGRAGTLMWWWLFAPLNLQRSDLAVFNTLCCYPGKTAQGTFAYPTGSVRKRAEATCAEKWLQPLIEWDPTISIVAMHPSAISRDVTPLPVVLRAVERAKVFAAKGERVLLLMGGKAAKHWMGYGENTTRWCNHWQRETEWTRRRRQERWDENRRLSVVKVKRERKLTAKTALAKLLGWFQRMEASDCNDVKVPYYEFIGQGGILEADMYNAMLTLCETKKKVKGEVESVVG